ncbi:MAG TPA: DUF1573 domain-containing protein [Verrucomicrobiota bacterium]|nr:DUF1573 domain-containing protein [Verrucomicrobiota bacterium]
MIALRTAICQLATIAGTLASVAELPPADPQKPNPWAWESTEQHLDLPAMTNLASFAFWVTNTSSETAVILATEADCDCTVVEARKSLPWTFQPGESGALNVRINTRGRHGLVTRPVIVLTSHGAQKLVTTIKIPLTPAPANVSPRQQDVLIARTNRQAVFQGRCAPCHAHPAMNQTGAVLFEKACGICHQAKRRAEMVPDLAALDRDADAAYWRQWITYGKKDSLMPAFATTEGGILDTNQIESLVEYLLKKYPADAGSADVNTVRNRNPATQ